MGVLPRVLQIAVFGLALGGASAFAADYDPHQAPEPYRFPDAYIDLQPYWLPRRRAMVSTPTGFVEASTWEVEIGARYFLVLARLKKTYTAFLLRRAATCWFRA